MKTADPSENIAIIGMAGRFPQAANLEEFWSNLRAGREAISFFKEEETQWLPIEEPPGPNDPHFVRVRVPLDRPEWFDAEFFRMNPREAAIMDPQHRVFLECAWEALENAGCDPERFAGSIGVFAGAGFNSYLINNLLTNRDLLAFFGLFAAFTLNEKDYLSTRAAYKLNLRGPSINVQTACSTSLVAVCLACQNLVLYHCDVALAGGVSIGFPTNRGHRHVEGGIMSQDGHCRAFDARASGTVVGNGAGVVVLKRLSEAIAAGDRVYAVIKGSAMNNDGGVKIGFTAPSIDGQAECVASAQAVAGCDPGTISYVEAHGTGTPLGDPIEIAALRKAFGVRPETRASCAIGSVKTNIGHLDAAAGIAGLIKTVLALRHGEIPPSLHYETPNPVIDFAHSPFFVNATLRPWPRGATPRRAGVSSFGIGGTNAHVVLEEAPAPAPAAPSRPHQLLLLSARTPAALAAATENLATHLEKNPALNLADVAFTLQTGRKAFPHRRAVVAEGAAGAIAALRAHDGQRPVQGSTGELDAKPVFMFPGQGAQAVNMARGLYETEPAFRRHVDDACDMVSPMVGLNLRDILFPQPVPNAPSASRHAVGGLGTKGSAADNAAELLRETRLTQPALFIIEHALARLWMSWGVAPAAMIGHSLGEYTAACLAGVFSLEDALALVTERARLMQAQPAGAMLAVRLPESAVAAWLNDHLALAAVNTPAMCVVSGPFDAIEALERKLAASAIASKRLATSHAFHSAMMEPVLAPLTGVLRRLVLHAPKIPWVSNVTGKWITPQQATSADYWAAHTRRTVRFADGLGEIVQAGHRILLEVGPGQTLAALAGQHPVVEASGVSVAATLERSAEPGSEPAAMLHALGQLWVAGVKPDWPGGFHARERRQIVTLPTYPFERKRHWIEPGTAWPTHAWSTTPQAMKEEAPAAAEPVTPPKARDDTNRNGSATLAVVTEIFQKLSGGDLSAAEAADRTFNQLGFDSLFLTQASVELNRRLGVAIAFRQLRDDLSTLRKVAARIDCDGGAAAPRAAKNISRTTLPPGEAEKRLPLTDAQREIWVVSQLGTEASLAYTESATLQLSGPVDVDALRRGLAELGARHEALRTTFAASGDVQCIASAAAVELSIHDCSAGAAGGRDAAAYASACIDRALVRPFNLETGPLFRPVLARIDAEHHVLALIVHHIICDGWSLGILVHDLRELYAAEAAQRPPVLAPAPLFSEYAGQQATERREAEFAAAEAYWRDHFAEPAPILDLPSDRSRPAKRNYAGDLVSCTLAPDLGLAVKQYCVEHEATVFTTLLGAFTVLLHRLTGQDDLVVGVPTAAQALDGQPHLAGHFANLLPIRSRLREGERFSEHLPAIQQDLNAALAHWRYPFVRLLQQLKLPRDASRVPLTPVVFNTTHLRGELDFGNLATVLTFSRKHFVNFDLHFTLVFAGNSLALGCYYSTELFDRSTIVRWLAHFETLLREIMARPEQPVAELPLLSAEQREQILVRWNDTQMPYERDAVISALFEAQVARTPDAIAIVAGESTRITYRELDARAGRLAGRLRAAGVGADALVGLFLERTPQLLIAILAILKAGGAYVPLDPKYPADRLEFIVSDTRMQIVVTQKGLRSRLPAGDFEVVFVDHESADRSRGDDGRLTANHDRPAATSLAYVIYTSGSTGRPKGVAITQRGVVALVAWARQFYRPEELDGVLFATSASFDISVFEIFCPLCLGGKIVLADSLLQLATLPARNEVRFLSGVPSAVAEIVRANVVPPSVTTVALAGEPFPQPLADALHALPHVRRVFELYGPTETTVYSTGGPRPPGSRPTLGRPLPNERIYLLDPRLQPVPVGVRGEIYIGGDKLARGYLHRPELTAEKFIASPFIPGERLYRSGDVGRWCADGTIESLGRTDHQVKVWGFRIELGEIEAVLAQHPAVAECVVVARPAPSGAHRLIAFVVPRDGFTLESRELRDHLQLQLPEYMIPATITGLERLPRTASGKVDRAALAKPNREPAAPAVTPPRTETERFVAEIWCEVLGLKQVGVHDNFFTLGGHSLHAMHVIARLNDSLGMDDLTWLEFFTTPTIAHLAPRLERALLRDIATTGTAHPEPDSGCAVRDRSSCESAKLVSQP